MSFVCSLDEISVMSRAFVQRSPKSVLCPTACDLETSTMRRPRPIKAAEPRKKLFGSKKIY